jgi:hypothetical protein
LDEQGGLELFIEYKCRPQQETNMSLDITSHPGRPGLDELVPSRYALRVGEIDVLVVSDGVLSLPGAMLGHNADPAVPGGLAGRHVPATREPLVATHLSFPSVCHVAVAGEVFRWVPASGTTDRLLG